MTSTRRSRAQLPFVFSATPSELTDEQFLGTPAPVGPDVAKSAASGISSGVQALIGMGGDIRHAADYGMLWAEAKMPKSSGSCLRVKRRTT